MGPHAEIVTEPPPGNGVDAFAGKGSPSSPAPALHGRPQPKPAAQAGPFPDPAGTLTLEDFQLPEL